MVRRGREVEDVLGDLEGCSLVGHKLTLPHFWGEETYLTEELLAANTAFLHPALVAVLAASAEEAVSRLFLAPIAVHGKVVVGEVTAGCEAHSQASAQQTLSTHYQHWLANLTTCLISRSSLSSSTPLPLLLHPPFPPHHSSFTPKGGAPRVLPGLLPGGGRPAGGLEHQGARARP